MMRLGLDPASEEKMKALKNKNELDKKMVHLFYEWIWDLMFLVLILLVVNGNQDSNIIYQNKQLEWAVLENIDDVGDIAHNLISFKT